MKSSPCIHEVAYTTLLRLLDKTEEVTILDPVQRIVLAVRENAEGT